MTTSKRLAFGGVVLAVLGIAAHLVARDATEPPTVAAGVPVPIDPPVQTCDELEGPSGPADPPAGAVRVDPGQHLGLVTNDHPPGTTFWLAPGKHVLGMEPFSQVIPKQNNVYVGAPGATLDGNGVNRYAFTQEATGVVIRYLTIKNFVPPMNEAVVNQSAGSFWTIEHNTIRDNRGAGVFLGSNNVVRHNCLTNNGQYGFSMYKPQVVGGSAITNIIVDQNEISYNNTDDLETRHRGCGCTGGGKFWDVVGARVTDNWVHHNQSVGLWADTNNIDFLFEGNYINDNDHVGIWYEISYNAAIRHNAFRRNALKEGSERASRGDRFPVGAIYLSEAGGDSRVSSAVTGTSSLEISENYFEDNWGGITLWESSERFCNSPGNTSAGYCTKSNPQMTLETCVEANIRNEPFYSDCRWKTQNVWVHHNQFHMNPAAVGNCSTTYCGRMAVLATWGVAYPTWSPYLGTAVQEAITLEQNNRWSDNQYFGSWRFTVHDMSRNIEFSAWRSAPYNQDTGSRAQDAASSPAAPASSVALSQPPPPTPPPSVGPTNHVGANSSAVDAADGWSRWYSANPSRSTEHVRSGSSSLRIDITDPYGWGLTWGSYPGLPTTPGNKTVGFWGRLSSGIELGVELRVKWIDSGNAVLGTGTVALPLLTSTWQHAAADVVAPAGTVAVWLELVHGSGAPGDFLHVDDITLADRAS